MMTASLAGFLGFLLCWLTLADFALWDMDDEQRSCAINLQEFFYVLRVYDVSIIDSAQYWPSSS